MRPIYVSLAAALLVSLPAAALAHAKLISTTPTAGATVAKPGKVELKFCPSSEHLAQLAA